MNKNIAEAKRCGMIYSCGYHSGKASEMKKIWVNKAGSFEEAKAFDRKYYHAMSGTERLEIVQFLRETHCKFRKDKNEGRKGF